MLQQGFELVELGFEFELEGGERGAVEDEAGGVQHGFPLRMLGQGVEPQVLVERAGAREWTCRNAPARVRFRWPAPTCPSRSPAASTPR